MKRKESNKKLRYPSLNAADLGIASLTYYDVEFTFATLFKKCDYKQYCNGKNSENIGVTAFK